MKSQGNEVSALRAPNLRRRWAILGLFGVAGVGALALWPPSSTPDSNRIHSSVHSPVSLRRVARVRTTGRPGGTIWTLAWSPSGRYLAAAVDNADKVVVLDASSWMEVCSFKRASELGSTTLAFLSDSELVTLADRNDNTSPWALALYESETGRVIRRVSRAPNWATASTTSLIVTSSRKYIVTSVSGATSAVLIYDAADGRFIDRLATPHGSRTRVMAQGPVNSLALNVALAGSGPAMRQGIYVFDVESNSLLMALSGHVPGVDSIAWSPGGQLIASGASGLRSRGNKEWIRDPDPIRVWDVHTGDVTASFTGYFEEVSGIAWHPSGEWFATTGRKNEGEYGSAIRLWSVPKKQMVFEFLAPGASLITAVSFHPVTGHLVCAWQGEIYVYRVEGLA
jgi:WD40 repeat protein